MFNWILDPIGWIITVPFWTILVTLPLVLLKYISLGIELIATALPSFLLFGGNGMSLNSLPEMFIRFIIIAAGLFFILWICVFFRYLFQNAESGIQSAKTAAKYSLLCWVYIMVIPLGIFALYLLIDWLIELLGAQDPTNGIANMLFLSIKPEGVDYNAWKSMADNNFLLSLSAFKSLGGMSNLFMIDFNMFLSFILSIGVLLAYLYAGITICIKIFDQVFLFCISPAIAATSILDGGKRISEWKDMMISKSFVVFGIILEARLYISLLGFTTENISTITGITSSSSIWTNFPNYIVILLIAAGGAFAFSDFGHVLAAFVGEGSSLTESKNQTKALLASGLTMTGLGKNGAISKFAAFSVKNKNNRGMKSFIKNNSNDGDGGDSTGGSSFGSSGLSSNSFDKYSSGFKAKFSSNPIHQFEYSKHKYYDNLKLNIQKTQQWRTNQLEAIYRDGKLSDLQKQQKAKEINETVNQEIKKHQQEFKNNVLQAEKKYKDEMQRQKEKQSERKGDK